MTGLASCVEFGSSLEVAWFCLSRAMANKPLFPYLVGAFSKARRELAGYSAHARMR